MSKREGRNIYPISSEKTGNQNTISRNSAVLEKTKIEECVQALRKSMGWITPHALPKNAFRPLRYALAKLQDSIDAARPAAPRQQSALDLDLEVEERLNEVQRLLEELSVIVRSMDAPSSSYSFRESSRQIAEKVRVLIDSIEVLYSALDARSTIISVRDLPWHRLDGGAFSNKSEKLN
jgi:hypothetical protein